MTIAQCFRENLWPGSSGVIYSIKKMHDIHLRNAYLKSLQLGGERKELLGLLFFELLKRGVENVPHIHHKMMKRYAEIAAVNSRPWNKFEWRVPCDSVWHDQKMEPLWFPKTIYREKVDPFQSWMEEQQGVITLRDAFNAGAEYGQR